MPRNLNKYVEKIASKINIEKVELEKIVRVLLSEKIIDDNWLINYQMCTNLPLELVAVEQEDLY